MGRILYGVMGDAGGHVSRSLAIAEQLKGHEVVFVGGGRVAELARAGHSVFAIPSLGTVLRDQRVDTVRTVAHCADALRQSPSVIARLTAFIREFDPDLIVTDYEYFLPRAARRLGMPCISVDRQHALTLCRYRPPAGHRLSRVLTSGIIRRLYSAASHYLICSFAPMQPIDPDLAEVLPPVLRRDVLSVEPGEGDHAVVYMRGVPLDWVRALVGGRRRRFLVYGFGIDQEEGNLCLRRNSSERFLADLASCAYVISNGGHNVISEALYYKKPLLCFPVRLFYEQLLNAHLLAEAGYGAWHEADRGARAAVDAFEEELPGFLARVAARRPWDSQAIASRLQGLMADGGGRAGVAEPSAAAGATF
jgi:uncharacterized protein (TIGR00661 family)